MANTNKFQKELDDLILQGEKLKIKIEQLKKSKAYFKSLADYADKEADITSVEKRLEIVEKEKRIFESMFEERKKQIKNEAELLKQTIRERESSDIIRERNRPKSGFSMQNVKDNIENQGGFRAAMNGFGKIVEAGSDIYIAEQKKSLNTWLENQDVYLKTLETGSKIFQRHLKTFSKGMQGALTSSFASITQGVQEGAYSAASSSVDFASETLTNMFADRLDKLKLQNFKELNHRKTEFENQKLTNQEIKTGVGLLGNVLSMTGPMGAAIGGLITKITESTTKILESNSEIEIKRLEKEIELNEKQLEVINEAKTSAIESAKDATQKILDFSKAVENFSLKTEEAAKSMVNIIGMSAGNVGMYKKFIYDATKNLKFTNDKGETTYLNKNAEDMLKIQSQYIDSSERNKTMTQDDFVKSFQLGKVLGDDNLAATLLGDMDYFNKSIASGTDLIYEMFQEANKAGVSNRKFAKDLQQNLKLAQKYTFQGGVKSMMKMSIWAQKTRFNMQSLEGMIDKIQEGGLEGVIEQGAKLQVLGGRMSMGADPLGMMYETWNDPEGLAKRFHAMTEGTGRFNTKTGEVEINGADAMRLKSYAEAIGMDYKEARAQVTQRIKGQEIDKQLKRNYTDEQKSLIYNKAQLNKNGEWEVVLDNGEKKNINDLNDTDWNSLMPTEESIENYVSKIYSLLEKQDGVTKNSQAVVADATSDDLEQNINKRIEDNLQWVNESLPTLESMVKQSNDFVTRQNKQQQDLMIATSQILEDQFNIIQKSTEKLYLGLTESGTELKNAINAVAKQLEYELAVIKHGEESEIAKEAKKKSAEAQDKLKGKILGEASVVASETRISSQDYEDAGKMYKWLVKNNSKENIDNIIGQLLNTYEDGKTNVNDYKKALTMYYNDILDAFEGAELGDDNMNSFGQRNMSLIHGLIKYVSENGEGRSKVVKDRLDSNATKIQIQEQKDSIANSDNKPMYIAASSVTPINDGVATIAKTDPKDSAIFAKSGGPFDTLFNGIFSKINDMHDNMWYNSAENSKDKNMVNNAVSNTLQSVLLMRDNAISKNISPISPKEVSLADFAKNGGNTLSNNITNNSIDNKFSPINVNINGKIELTGNNNTYDISEILTKNPLLIRKITELIVEQIGSNMNGGKTTLFRNRYT